MKLKLTDKKNRVYRLLHRTTPGGELVLIDLRFGYRGEIFCHGSEDGRDFLEIRCRSTSGRCRWDPITIEHLVKLEWPLRANRRVLHIWSKGTCEILLAPLNEWMPSSSKLWTCLKDSY